MMDGHGREIFPASLIYQFGYVFGIESLAAHERNEILVTKHLGIAVPVPMQQIGAVLLVVRLPWLRIHV